jgi:hypothetical protein
MSGSFACFISTFHKSMMPAAPHEKQQQLRCIRR